MKRPESVGSQSPSRIRYQVLAFVCVLSMITYLDRAAMASAAPSLAVSLSLTGVEQLKWAFTSFTIAYAIFEIPTGWLGDRWGPRGVLIRIVAWWSLCTALTGLVGMKVGDIVLGGLATLVVLRFLFGAGEAGAYPNITRVVHNWFPSDQPAELELITTGHLKITERAHGTIPWRAFLTNRNLWILCLMYVCLGYGWFFNITYLPTYMSDRYSLDDRSIVSALYKGGPLWVGAAGCLMGGILVGWLSRRLGNRRAGRRMLGVAAMSLCGACWLAAINAPTALLFFLFVSTAAFCNDLTLGPAWATCQDIGQRFAAVTAAWMNTVGTVGAGLTAYLTGAIVGWAVESRAAALGLPIAALPLAEKQAVTVVGYRYVFISYASAYIVAASCWLFIDPNKRVVQETSESIEQARARS